jgi:histidinol phosphatase-like PHP family hydrolase
MPLTNAGISELLAQRADDAEGHRQRAYQRASRAALMWPEEASALIAEDRSLEDLYGVGPSIAKRIHEWIESDQPAPDPPELRYDFLTLAEARSVLDAKQEYKQMRGDLQMHTTYSDGSGTVEDMAREGIELGYEYIAVTEHTKGLKIARGMDEDGFLAQNAEVDEVNAMLGGEMRVLKAVEMNLNTTGEGDMDPVFLQDRELVLGSFHSALRETRDSTPRYLDAIANPFVRVIGHPRARKYNRRLGLVANWERVLEAAALSGTAMEINSFPDRQDFNVEVLKLASDENVFSIGTDAHSTDEMHLFEFGLAAAAKAGIDRKRILNFWSADEIVEWATGA